MIFIADNHHFIASLVKLAGYPLDPFNQNTGGIDNINSLFFQLGYLLRCSTVRANKDRSASPGGREYLFDRANGFQACFCQPLHSTFVVNDWAETVDPFLPRQHLFSHTDGVFDARAEPAVFSNYNFHKRSSDLFIAIW